MPSNEQLVEMYQSTNDGMYLEMLIKKNENLVHKLSAYYYRPNMGFEREDLIGEGRIGLIKAAKTFSKDKSDKFITNAYHHIHGAIIHYIRDKGWMVRIPNNLVELEAKFNKKLALHGLEPSVTTEKLAEATGMGIEECDRLIQAHRARVHVVSYNEKAPGDGDGEFVELIPDASNDYVEDELSDQRTACKAIIHEFLSGNTTMDSLARRYNTTTVAIRDLIANKHLFGFSA